VDFSADGRWLVAADQKGARLFAVLPRVGDDSRTLSKPRPAGSSLGWSGGGFIGYEQGIDDVRIWDYISTYRARFLGKSGIVVILYKYGLILGIDAEAAYRAGADIQPRVSMKQIWDGSSDVPGLVFSTMTNEDDVVLATSPDGRWIVVGSMIRSMVIDLSKLARLEC
jgi:hypothetical protein